MQMRKALAEAQIAALDTFITGLEARKTALA